MSTFVAIDFETANQHRSSACSVAVAVGCEGRIVASWSSLIRPPTPHFSLTGVHGLCWDDVRGAPTFGEVWPALRGWLLRGSFVVAHNASFDKGVLDACCRRYGLQPPAIPFRCTVQVARAQWSIRPTTLPRVCGRLGIRLRHHDAGSDAEACARIVLAAEKAGWQWSARRRPRRGRRTRRRPAQARGRFVTGQLSLFPLMADVSP